MKHRLLYIMLFSVIALAACNKNFTERPALDTPTVDNYYNNAEQVRGATATLYGLAWFDFLDKGLDCKAYESGDMRRKWSVMEHGAVYPQWKPVREGNTAFNNFMANGYRYDTAQASPLGIKTSTRSNISKYVVGPGSSSEPVLAQKTQICTYILRYADVLLIYAESVLGTNASTSDASALAAINKVRARAGLTPFTSFTKNDILHERRVELAFEGDYWFDITRQGYATAKQIIEAQNRGFKNDNGSESVVNPSFNQNQMLLPIPISETAQNPLLMQPAVAYY